MSSQGGRGGQKFPILLSKKATKRGGGGQKLPILHSKNTTKRGGGGQKLSILRRHSLWTAPKVKSLYTYVLNNESNVHRWRFTTWSTVQLFRAVRTCAQFMTVTGIWTGFYPISKNSSAPKRLASQR